MTGNVTDIDNVWALLALLVVLGVPSLFTYLNTRSTRRTTTETHDTLKREVTTNSGTTLKDALNRIEGVLAEHTETLASQDQTLETIGARVETLEEHDLTNHPPAG